MQSNIFVEEKPIINIKPVAESEQEPESSNIQSENMEQVEKKYSDIEKVSTEIEGKEKKYEEIEPTTQQAVESMPKEEIYAKLDENAEKELPSVTEQRGSQLGLDYQRELKEEEPSEEKQYSELELKEKEEPEKVVEDLPTMDTERESIVEKEARWEKEHGMEPETEPVSAHRQPNPDIRSESEYPKQHRPSLSDEEQEREEFKPSNKQETIYKLQKSLKEREEPTIVKPSGGLNLGVEQTQPRPPIGATEEIEKESEEFKQKFGKLKIELKEKHPKKTSLKSKELTSPEEEEEEEEHKAGIPAEKFDLQEIINYLSEHKHVIEDSLSESDKKKIQTIMHLAKDIKNLFEEGLETMREDLMGFYELAKNKFAHALSEIKATDKARD